MNFEDWPLLKIENLNYIEKKPSFLGFKKKQIILSDINFELQDGESLSIIGDENSGKNHLISIIAGLKSATSGKIYFQGVPLEYHSKNKFSNIRMIFQDPENSLNPHMKIKELLEIPLILNTTLKEEERQKHVNEIMDLVDLTADIANQYPHSLSIGQKKRIALARALILNPKIILSNSNIANYEPTMKLNICYLMKKLQTERKINVISVSSDFEICRAISSKIIVLSEGKIVEMGNTKNIIENPTSDITKKLLLNYQNEYRYVSTKKNKTFLYN